MSFELLSGGLVVGVCIDPFFLYIPFLDDTKKCLGMNKILWKVATALRTAADSGLRLLLIFRFFERRKRVVAFKKFVRFYAIVYLILYLTVSHVIGASWYYLSIKQQVSCWNHAYKIDTRYVHSCDGTTISTLNSTIVNDFCPINPPNAAVFNYGIYLDALRSRIVEDKGLQKEFLQCFFWGLRNLCSFASNLQTSTNGGETFFAVIISVLGVILLIYSIGNIQWCAELASARSERIAEKLELIKPKIELLVKTHKLKEGTEDGIMASIKWALNENDSFHWERLRSHPILKHETITDSLLKGLRFLEKSILNRKLDILAKAEKWLFDNNIPPDQNSILFYLTCGLEDDQDVNLNSVLSVLPPKHEWITKKHLCFDTLKKVPRLHNIDEEWFKSIRSKLKPVIYRKESNIFREGEPLDFVIFITNGIAWSYTTSTNAGGRVSVSRLEKGKIFGEELLQWKLERYEERRELKLVTDENTGKLKLDRILLSTIPISTANVKSHTQVEALVLMTNDLDLCSDFPVATSKLQRIIWKQMILNAFLRKRSKDSATEGVASSSGTVEGASVQREIEEV